MPIVSIPANDRVERLVAAGGQTVFPFDFPVYATSDLEVRRVRAGVETILALNADYLVTGAGEQAGGTITLTTPALANDLVVIRSAQPIARTTDFADGGDLPAASLDSELNRIAINQQQIEGIANQALRLPPSDPIAAAVLPGASARANGVVGFDGAGQVRIVHPIVVDMSGPTALYAGEVVVDGGLGGNPANGEPSGDDTAAIQGAINSVISTYGGGRVVLHRSHKWLGGLTIPPNVELCYRAPPLANRVAGVVNNLHLVPAMWAGPAATLTVQHSLRNLMVLPAGFSTVPEGTPNAGGFNPATMRQMLDLVARFASNGSPIQITSPGGAAPRAEEITLADVSGFAFQQLITSNGGTRMAFDRIWGDCNNLMRLENSGGFVRIDNLINRLYLSSGVRGSTALQAPVIGTSNVGGKLAVTIGPTPNPYPAWVAGILVGKGEEYYQGANFYSAFSTTDGTWITGATPPTHTAGRVSDGNVTWTYKGAYTGTLYTPDQIAGVGYGGTGFLAAGDPIYLTLPPASCPGGDILDPAQRGRLIVLDIQSVSSSAATIVLDTPWDAGVAAAITASTKLLILPGARVGTTLRTIDVDTLLCNGFLSKGSRFDAWVDNASGHQFIGFNSEPGAEGENDAGEWGNIGVIAEGGADRFYLKGKIKSKGTLVRWNIGGARPWGQIDAVLRNAEFRHIDVVSGSLRANVTFETNARVHSRSSAGHLWLEHTGVVPAFSGDGNFMERISHESVLPKNNARKRERWIGGGTGVSLGVGAAVLEWQAGTAYLLNAQAWNTVATTGDQMLYIATVAGTSGTGAGPQGIVEGATETDGTVTWRCVGPYAAGNTLIRANGVAGTAELRAAATGADAPDLLCATTSATAGRGLQAPRGLVVNVGTAVNPAGDDELIITKLNSTTLRLRYREGGTTRTLDLGPFT
jgi:hypothetical protein